MRMLKNHVSNFPLFGEEIKRLFEKKKVNGLFNFKTINSIWKKKKTILINTAMKQEKIFHYVTQGKL